LRCGITGLREHVCADVARVVVVLRRRALEPDRCSDLFACGEQCLFGFDEVGLEVAESVRGRVCLLEGAGVDYVLVPVRGLVGKVLVVAAGDHCGRLVFAEEFGEVVGGVDACAHLRDRTLFVGAEAGEGVLMIDVWSNSVWQTDFLLV
jgi:hypothetical protein